MQSSPPMFRCSSGHNPPRNLKQMGACVIKKGGGWYTAPSLGTLSKEEKKKEEIDLFIIYKGAKSGLNFFAICCFDSSRMRLL